MSTIWMESPLLPQSCVCGTAFSVDHALNCPCGGLPSQRHNHSQDITASLMSDTCQNVSTEPVLQSLSGESLHPRSAITDYNARSDISANGFWSCSQQSSYFNIKTFNPTAATYRKKSISSCYHLLEERKRREYQDRIINVEHDTFSPIPISIYNLWWYEPYILYCLLEICLTFEYCLE